MKSKHLALILIIISSILISGCTAPETDDSEICTKADTGESMTFDKAKIIAQTSACGAQGTLKDTYMCNNVTGTWWIDLNIEQPGCNPACVINVATKEVEINWRCTGLIE